MAFGWCFNFKNNTIGREMCPHLIFPHNLCCELKKLDSKKIEIPPV